MAEIGLAVAQTLFAALQCSKLKEFCSIWGYKSRLADLNQIVTTIKNVLLDAESKELTNEAQGYIDELKDAVYDADDLFDEFVTLLELNQLEKPQRMHGEFFQKVCRFFSSNKNQVSHAYRMFHKVKKIQKKLHAIADNHEKFAIDVDYKPICMRGEETCSYVDVRDIIGRDDDKKAVIHNLSDSKNEVVRFVTITGVAGLGKTALAQLVYNDEKIKQEFGKLCFWVCVSDQGKQFNVKAILCKILELVTRKKSLDTFSLETLQNEFRENLEGKKYLLVLDDVWNEDRQKWVVLERLLMVGQGGSAILVTTRSEITAGITGDGRTYRLQGLSPKDSWQVFEMAAFSRTSTQQLINHSEMLEAGNNIVDKCYNNPLAIKVVGSLLFGQDISKWRTIEKSTLAKIDNGDSKIMPVLKLSYHNLRPSLKSCFIYCAVLPKDFEIEKRLLINLWMAQGYITPLDGGQSIEDAAEEHFSILLRRCFFQDAKKDKYDDVKSVKIHDLMHDLAEEVGGEEHQVLSSIANKFGGRTRHVSTVDETSLECSSDWTNLRSLINLCHIRSVRESQVGNWRSLRVLDLSGVEEGISLNSIGRLHHLRYLNLSHGSFAEPPSSITTLHNLQTLILYDCPGLRQLPYEFSKLVNLRHLDVDECDKLACMPLCMDKLTKLRVLTKFVVGGSFTTEKECDDELKNLGTLTSLRGYINIHIGERYRNFEVRKDMCGGYLSNMKDLKQVQIKFDEDCFEPEAVLRKLQPHRNLKGLFLTGYKGKTIPRWGRAEDNWGISYPNLVKIKISGCERLQNMPSISKLPHLKSLKLEGLNNLEYMEKTGSSTNSSAEATDSTFFPSLEILKISHLEKLKGWFSGDGLADVDNSLSSWRRYLFPCLSKLQIHWCGNLTSFPPCPFVKEITLFEVNKTSQLLKKMMVKDEEQGVVNVGNLTSSLCLATLSIYNDKELECLSEFENVFRSCASSLQSLQIWDCNSLTRFSRGLEHLTALESLQLLRNHQLNFSEDVSDNTMPWIPLHQSLRSLYFGHLENMTCLPEGMQYLTSLQTLELEECSKLKDLPECIGCLSSLQSLSIEGCCAIKSLPEGIRDLNSLQYMKISCFNLVFSSRHDALVQHLASKKVKLVIFSKYYRIKFSASVLSIPMPSR